MSDDRPKKSWREIDKGRDKSTHRREEKSSPARPTGGRTQKSYRAALDRLFDSGKIGELVEQVAPTAGSIDATEERRVRLERQLVTAEGRDAITKAADAYLAEFALPEDAEALAKILEHPDADRQRQALEKLLPVVQAAKPKRARALLGRLKLIRETSDDREEQELARRILDLLE